MIPFDQRPASANRPFPHRRGRVAALALTASALLSFLVGIPSAAAAPTEVAHLVLTNVSGARVGRGGAPAMVHADVRNTGSTSVTGVRVRYHLPTGISVAPASSPSCTGTEEITCLVGSIPAGGSASVDIAVSEPSTTAVLGTRTGYFLPPTSDGYDPGAGEILESTWNHDAGAEGTDMSGCWPINNPSPNMDVANDVCDGTNDAAPLVPDSLDVLTAFPQPFSESVVRSWQFETEVVAPRSGSYRACGTAIDDGGYLAMAPVGSALTPDDLKVSVGSYGSATGAPFELLGGERYRVVMRVSNRGFAGIDNGAQGGTLGGWDGYGIAPTSQSCGVVNAAVFGTDDGAWVQRTVADVVVVGTSDLTVLGAVESGPVNGRRLTAVRVVNTGPDATSARLAFTLPFGGIVTTPIEGCDRADADTPSICELDRVDPLSSDGRIVTMGFSADRVGFGWSLSATSTVDGDPADNADDLSGP